MKGYRTTKKPDGVLIVHDVEIFVECEKGGHEFDAEWIEAAVLSARNEGGEGYLPPLHLRHHGDGDSIIAAGQFEITGTRSITFQGQSRLAVIADLHIVDPGIQSEFLAGKLPYRSVEIFDVRSPCIDSLALLDHEPPFLRLPLLRPETAYSGADFRHDRACIGEAVLSCRTNGEQAQLIFRAGPDTMTTKQKAAPAPKPKGVQFSDDEKKTDEKKDGENMEAGEDGGLDVTAVVKAIEDGSIPMKDFAAIQAAMAAAGPEPEMEEEEAPAAAQAPAPQAMSADHEGGEKFARLQGKLDALEAKAAAREERESAERDVRSAMARLQGRALPDDVEEKLTAFRAECKDKALFGKYVDAYEANLGYEMPDDGSAERLAGQNGQYPEVAMQFAAQGAGAMAKAAKFAREFEELKAHGKTGTVEDYVTRCMKRNAR